MRPTDLARDTVIGLLSGLGVEDIAVMGCYPVDEVRAHVAHMADTGALPGVVKQARERARAASCSA